MKCTQCGNEIRAGLQFCTKCGTPVSGTASVSNANEFQVVFEREKKFGAMANKFVVKVDGTEMCRLANGESKTFYLSRGRHQVEVGMLMYKSTKFMMDVYQDRHLKCHYNTGKSVMLNPLLFSMIVVTDERGEKL